MKLRFTIRDLFWMVLVATITFSTVEYCWPQISFVSLEDNSHDDGPMTISASNVGRFSHRYSWYLSVNSAGHAKLTIATMPQKTILEFNVKSKDLLTLRDEIATQKFFDLQNQYGELVPDGSASTITITIGQTTKTVRLDYIKNATQKGNKNALHEIQRAIRVSQIIRGWFDDPRAFDSRPYEIELLKP
jgi:hypothetical protein